MRELSIMGVRHVRLRSALQPEEFSIERSLGFVDCQASAKLSPIYIPYAVAPTLSWEAVDDSYLGGFANGHDGRSITLFKIEPDFLGYLRDVLESSETEDDVRDVLGVVEGKAEALLSSLGAPACGMRLRGFFENPPNRITLTWDVISSRHVGLHVDNFESTSDSDRLARPPRASFNIGLGPRYFLFCDATVKEVIQYAIDNGFEGLPLSQKIRHFLLADQSSYTYRIRLSPGHGYMASTENIIHEGSNFGSAEVDRTVVFFSPSALEAASEVAAG